MKMEPSFEDYCGECQAPIRGPLAREHDAGCTRVRGGSYDGLPLGIIVGQLLDLTECEEVDCVIAHGECRGPIAAHFDLARERVLAAFDLDSSRYRAALIERLGNTPLAFEFGRLV